MILRAEQPDDGFFLPVKEEWTINISKVPQTVTWTGTADEILALNVAHPVGAAASGPAVITNGTITVTGVGTVSVRVEQTGDATYASASLTRHFNLRQAVLTPVGGYETSGYAVAVQVVGNYAYVADSGEGLQVIDVSNPGTLWRSEPMARLWRGDTMARARARYRTD